MTENKEKKGSFFNCKIKLWLLYFSVLGLVVVFFYGVTHEWFGPMPTFEQLENPETSLASEIYSGDGLLLGTYYIENRSNVQYRELPPHLVEALLAIEDIRFENHSGVDIKALFRVSYGVLTGNHKGGGSTLTQQLAKNLFPRRQNLSTVQLIMRKFKEWVTATKLERNYSKQEILAMYLNTVPFGSQAFGVKAAAKTFFNKVPDSLTVEESAMLVGLIKGPTWYSPTRNPERSLERRNLVMSQMNRYEFLTSEELDSLSLLPIDLSNYGIRDHKSGPATYFREILRMELREWCSNHFKADGTPYDLYQDGLRIHTTIDSRMQKHAEEAVITHLRDDLQPAFYRHWKGYTNAPFVFEKEEAEEQIERLIGLAMKWSERYRVLKENNVPEDSILINFNTPVGMKIFAWDGEIDTVLTPIDSIRYYKYFLQAGMLAMHPITGEVKAYVGGIDYRHFKYDHVKLTRRQVGSTFKPFLYTLAMQEGEFSPCTKVANVQYSVDLPNGDIWTPRNSSDDRIGEEVSLKWALANSNNWISAFLIKRYSPLSVIKIARKMGVTADLDPVPAIALGSSDISLWEMIGAFNTFADKGVHVEPIMVKRIEDKYGNIIEEFSPERKEAMSEETAYLMLELMKGVVMSGTGRRLRYKYGFTNPIAGKTGTTQNQSDGWFIGITPELSTGIWVGAEDRAVHFRTITLGQGANMALPIYALFMQKVLDDPELNISTGDFEKPLEPLSVEIDCDKVYRKDESPDDLMDDIF